MGTINNFAFDEWLNRWDMEAVPNFDDKVKECEFFFESLSAETNRNRFRWFVSAFMNAAYSFFESSAVTAYFRFTDSHGNPQEDHEGLSVLGQHVRVFRNEKKPNFVKTAGLTPLTTQLYDFRKKNTHHYALSIMAVGTSLPEDFHFGNMRGEGTLVLPLCREVIQLIRAVHLDINI